MDVTFTTSLLVVSNGVFVRASSLKNEAIETGVECNSGLKNDAVETGNQSSSNVSQTTWSGANIFIRKQYIQNQDWTLFDIIHANPEKKTGAEIKQLHAKSGYIPNSEWCADVLTLLPVDDFIFIKSSARFVGGLVVQPPSGASQSPKFVLTPQKKSK